MPIANKPRLFWAGVCTTAVALVLGLNAQSDEQWFGPNTGTAAQVTSWLALALLLTFVAGGRTRRRPRVTWGRWTWLSRLIDLSSRLSELGSGHEGNVVTALAAFTCGLGLVFGSSAAGGADSYGYISEVELWLSGRLIVAQPWVHEVPWPNAALTFAPLGYTPLTRGDPGSIVPIYSPGLPLLMAAVKLVAGHALMFFVPAISAASLVVLTFRIGRRLGAPRAGAIGALFVASSPTVLFMMEFVMSDVPVAAAWGLAFYLLLGRGRTSAFGAGLTSAAALLIRPNLAAGAALFGLKYLVELIRGTEPRSETWARGISFVVGVVPGVIIIASVNRALFGSPFASGYGPLQGLFGAEHVLPNLRLYGGWFLESQTPLVLLGLAAILLPFRQLWPNARDRVPFAIIAGFVLSVIVLYAFYLQPDSWWYLRYLLPIWPFVMLGMGAIAVAASNRGKWARRATVAVVPALAFAGYLKATHLGAFEIWRGEARYVSAGHLVRRHTPPGSVIFSMQHSGSLRYYGGRVTLRYDWLDPAWLDRTVSWLSAHGAHPYLLVDDWELPMFQTRFKGQAVLERTNTPTVSFEQGGRVWLFDLAGSNGEKPLVVSHDPEPVRWVKPQPLPALVWRGPSS